MNLDLANKWLTLIANIGVLAGIVFLAFELQHNTVATQLEVASNFQSSFSDIEMLIAGDPEFAEILIKGRVGAEMSSEERFRLAIFYTNVLRQWQFVHLQYLSEALEEDIWIGQRNYFAMVLSDDAGIQEHWLSNKSHFSPGFNAMVQSLITRTDGSAEHQ